MSLEIFRSEEKCDLRLMIGDWRLMIEEVKDPKSSIVDSRTVGIDQKRSTIGDLRLKIEEVKDRKSSIINRSRWTGCCRTLKKPR